jgi:HD-GYP domain-containing protein (c-di-GMP phosphodiesterase class II)
MGIIKNIKLDQGANGVPSLIMEGRNSVIIELCGLTRPGRHVLNNKPLTVLYFPFRIGRLSRTDLASSSRQDLLIPDMQPYSVSRNHVVFERVDEKIFLVDEDSTCGTIIDDMRLGHNYSGETRVELSAGVHTLAIGGSGSPFLFSVTVRQMRQKDFQSIDGDVPDRFPQARMLYEKLVQYERNLLDNKGMSASERGMAAEGMVRVIVSRPDLLDLLRCLAANPVSGPRYLAQHSVNVAIFSIVLLSGLRYPPDETVKAAAAALLHDIGMQEVDPGILEKNGTLTFGEYESVKKHASIGGELLDASDDVCVAASAVARDHHERVDKSGYPRGVNLLPDVTRFVGLLDCFEAMTHDRPQRPAFSPHAAVRVLTGAANTGFDPDTRKAFLSTFTFFPVSTIVRLSTGEIAQVVAVNEGAPLAPTVRVLASADGTPPQSPRQVDLSKIREISIVKDVRDPGLARRFGCAAPVQA